jgi:hypothetical protein
MHPRSHHAFSPFLVVIGMPRRRAGALGGSILLRAGSSAVTAITGSFD